MNLRGFLGKDEKVKVENSKLDYYKELMTTNGNIEEFRFANCDFDKGLIGFDDDVELFLPISDLVIYKENKDAYLTFANLDRVYTLKVVDIDEENKRVTVSFRKAQQEMQAEAIKSIDEALSRGEHPVVDVSVFSMMTNDLGVKGALVVDILGLGIYGTVKASEWSEMYTYDLRHVVKNGDVFKVAIQGKSDRAGMRVYYCSRKECADESWDEFLKRFHVGNAVTVQCVARGDKYFVGKLLGYKNVLCRVRYPKFERVGIGKTYRGFIKVAEKGKPIQVGIGSEL